MDAHAPVTTRAAVESDLPRLTEIYNHYVVHTPTTFDLDPFTVDERREWFARYAPAGRHRLLVAEDAGGVVAYASSSRYHPRAAYDTTIEMTVLCAAEAVGRGLGRALYARMFEILPQEDVHLAMALITMPNDASVALHEAFGFERGMLLPEAGRKFGQWWDVLYMMRRMP